MKDKKLWDFLLRFSTSCIVQLSHVGHIFALWKHVHLAIYHVVTWPFFLHVLLREDDGSCEFLLIMPPSKVCPNCDTVV